MSKEKEKYKCLLCRRVMDSKTPHNCNHGFRKRGLKWEESVVKENLTSEERADMGIPVSVKNRAKEYAINEWRCFCVEKSEFSRATLMRFCRNDFLAGYHSRDEEVKELREALTEVVDTLQERCDKYGMSPIEHEALAKAKQLINIK